jgi:hypothetical protein
VSVDVATEYSFILPAPNDQALTILFEPGAGQFTLEPGTHLQVRVSGPEGEQLELAHGPGYIAVWPSPALAVAAFDHLGLRLPLLGH